MIMPATHRFSHKGIHDGFTLMEILIVIAIASILVMISVPFYQNYTVRTKVSGDLSLMHPLMQRMNEEYALNNKWPSSNAEAGALEPSEYRGTYLSSAEVSDTPQAGTMTLTYNEEAIPVLRGMNTLVYYPGVGSGSNNWQCGQGTMPSKYRPPNCR